MPRWLPLILIFLTLSLAAPARAHQHHGAHHSVGTANSTAAVSAGTSVEHAAGAEVVTERTRYRAENCEPAARSNASIYVRAEIRAHHDCLSHDGHMPCHQNGDGGDCCCSSAVHAFAAAASEPLPARFEGRSYSLLPVTAMASTLTRPPVPPPRA